MIRLQFVLGKGVSSKTIAWFSAGHFSHVDIVLPDNRLLGARSDAPGGTRSGVQIRPPFYEKWDERVVMSMETSLAQERSFYDFLMPQVGKPYDSTAIWGFVAGRDWRSDDAWYCSELGTAAIEVAAICPLLYTPRNKVTPAGLATVMSALGASVLT